MLLRNYRQFISCSCSLISVAAECLAGFIYPGSRGFLSSLLSLSSFFAAKRKDIERKRKKTSGGINLIRLCI